MSVRPEHLAEYLTWHRGIIIAIREGDPCECDTIVCAVGSGHLADCANRKRGDTRRRMAPQQVVDALLALP